MTLSDAQARYDSVLSSMGVTETEFQSRRLSYSSGDARIKELTYLSDLITKLTDQQNGTTSSSRCTLATFRRD